MMGELSACGILRFLAHSRIISHTLRYSSLGLFCRCQISTCRSICSGVPSTDSSFLPHFSWTLIVSLPRCQRKFVFVPLFEVLPDVVTQLRFIPRQLQNPMFIVYQIRVRVEVVSF